MPVYSGFMEHHGPFIIQQLLAMCPEDLYLTATYEKLVISEDTSLVIMGRDGFSERACYLNYRSWDEDDRVTLTLTEQDAIHTYRDPVRYKRHEEDNWSRPHDRQYKFFEAYTRFLSTSHVHPFRFNYYTIATAIIVWMQLGIQVEEL